jgi:polysaccharide chain length determinant protein (PEP-CTERM system associated)
MREMAVETPRTENFRLLLLEHAIAIWKQKWLALAVAWAVCLIGWAGVMLLPQRYESNARAFVDVNGLLTPLLKGLVVDTAPGQSEGYLRQTLLSRPNLDQVIVLANVGGASLSQMKHERLVNDLAKEIKVTTEGNNLVSIAYANPDPVVAKNVVESLLTIFAEKAANSSRAEMDRARAFLSDQISSYEKQLRAAEQRRAAFRKKYAAYFNDSGIQQPALLLQQMAQARQQYEDAVASRNALAAQTGQVPQLLAVTSAPAVSNSGEIVVASPEVRLSQASRNLGDLKLLYTEKHPDVISAQHTVDELKAQIATDKKTGGSNEGKTQISNPAYEQLRLKLADAQALIPVLKQRFDRATQDYNRAKLLSADLPEIGAKSQDIDRDYEVIKANYDELVKRRESANLSQAADDRADRTQFRIVDPPEVPIFASFPNRLVLFSFVLLLGLGAGAASPLVLAQIRPTFGSTAALRNLGLPVIGAITFVRTARTEFGAGGAAVFSAAIAVLFLSYGGLLLAAAGLSKGNW